MNIHVDLNLMNKFRRNFNQNSNIVIVENKLKYQLQNVGHFVHA